MNHWILIVEDDKDIQASLLDLLEIEGYSVRGALDGQQALDILRDSESLPSLILLDLVMRGMDGREFRQQQLQDPRLAAIPVVIMSADSAPSSQENDLGISQYLSKPADVADILDVVSQHIRPPSSG